MAGPQIDVSANVGRATQAIDNVNKALDSTGKTVDRVSKKQYRPLAPGALDELREAVKLLEKMGSLHGNMPGTSHPAPRAPAPGPAPAPEADDSPASQGRRRHRGRWSHYGENGTFGRFFTAFTSPMGGATSTIAGEAMAGSRGMGGFSGMGLLRGGILGAGLFGAFKAGQALMEGFENAKTLATEMDRLKRQMGDIGVSFNMLTTAADAAARGLEINSVEAGKLMSEFNRLSGGVKTTGELMEGTRTGVGLSKAMGLDPSSGVGFLANMRNIMRGGSAEGDRRLALLIGDVVARSGVNGRADEMMQALQSFAASTSRISLTNPNLAGFSGAYAGLLSARIPGLTPENAAALLGQANSAMMNMGAFGEASETFTLSALGRYGNINPIQARVLSEGGLFGNRSSAFGAGSIYRRYMKQNGMSDADIDKLMGSNSGVSNFQAIREQLDSMNVDPNIKAEMAKNFFGLSSISQAMALLSASPEEIGRTEKLLGARGINIQDFNETGIMTLSRIANAGGLGDLRTVGRDMMGRTGKGALSVEERARLSAAIEEAQRMGGDAGFKKLQDVLTDLAADKDKQETLGSQMLDQQKRIETAMTGVGQTLLGPLTDMKELLMAGFKMSENRARERVLDLRKGEINEDFDKRRKAVMEKYAGQRTQLAQEMAAAKPNSPEYKEAERKKRELEENFQRELNEVESERQSKIQEADANYRKEREARDQARRAEDSPGQAGSVSAGQASALSRVQFSDEENRALERAAGGDPKKLSFLKNVLRIENRGKSRVDNNAVSSAGAKGAFQFMPSTAASLASRLGMSSYDVTNFDDAAKLAGAYYDELDQRYGGNRLKMYADYNGGPNLARRAGNTGNRENDDYVAMGKHLDEQGTAMPKSGKNVMSDYPPSWQRQSLAPWDLTFRLVGEDGRQRAAPINVSVPVPSSSGSPR